MIDFARLGCNVEDNRRWNDFLQAWPLERLRTMSLADYTQAGSAETFTAWLEQRLENLGSMWGGSAFKFGIFSRANKEKRESKEGARYTDAYAWTGKYGETPEAAFTKIRSLVVSIAEAASRGDTAAIDGIELGPVYKWKIAFHYQNLEAPTVLAIYKPEPLRRFLKSTAADVPMSQLYRDVLAKKPKEIPLMEFCGDIYAAWQENLPLWKLTHSSTALTAEEHERLLRGRLIVVNVGANKALSEQFRDKAKVGDLFYLCRDASVALLGRITSDARLYEEKGSGWYARNYEVLRYAASPNSFSGQDANWTPKSAATFCAVGPQTLATFQRSLLRPVFNIDLQLLEELRDAAQGKAADVVLTQGAIDNGYLAFPLAASIFPETSYGDRPGATRGAPVRMVTEYGETYEDDIRVEGNTLRPRARFGTYFKKVGAMPGDRIRVSGNPDKLYLLRVVPSGTAPIASLPQPDPIPMPSPSTIAASLNVILYGPPGTGKTYLTAERAVQICDGAVPSARHDLMQRYGQLCDAGRISFVTFHQSFSYEDFVEGIRPEVNGEGQISYDVRDGIFKRICDVAREKFESKTMGASIDLSGRKLYKMSLGNTLDPADASIFERCIEKGIILLGYGSDIDYTGCDTLAAVRERFRAQHPDPAEDTEYNITAVHYLKNEMKNGDLVLVSDGNFKFRAVGEITGEYKVTSDPGGNQMRPVRWLKVLAESLPIETIFTKRLSQMTIYLMDQSAVKWEALKTLVAPTQESGESQNYVLIIDEINRANISKTLGELITLLEPDKRLDAANPLRVNLPYSGKDFGVPSNLFIVGTMNTADRSIALLDTALRRRFEFVELRPRADLLSDDVEGVNLRRLLEVLNQRVEYLFDREHTIGHAYFLGVESLDQLSDVFRRKIIPLLQEYFYEDWEKVGAALNDDGTNGGGFLVVEDLPVPPLFASDLEDSRSRRCHRVNPAAFSLAAFLRVYE